MKKFIALIMVAFMILSLAACSQSNSNNEPSSKGETSTDNVAVNSNTGTDDTDNNTESTQKILVAYFSATGTTKGVAETAADAMGADLYEIVPKDPYTSADLDYSDNNSRSTKEMNDPNARPEINGSVENMEQYDIIFLGYPIWWGDAPRIISTFMESYDFSGKTIVPFCTSGGSGVGSSAENLESLVSGATWVSGERLNGGASHNDIVEWINGLDLNITTK